jgi:hypothetical protein
MTSAKDWTEYERALATMLAVAEREAKEDADQASDQSEKERLTALAERFHDAYLKLHGVSPVAVAQPTG